MQCMEVCCHFSNPSNIPCLFTMEQIVNLKNGYSDLEAMVTEAEAAFDHCGEPGKALQASQLKPVLSSESNPSPKTTNLKGGIGQ